MFIKELIYFYFLALLHLLLLSPQIMKYFESNSVELVDSFGIPIPSCHVNYCLLQILYFENLWQENDFHDSHEKSL